VSSCVPFSRYGTVRLTCLLPLILPCSLSSQFATLQRQLTLAKDELATTIRSKNSERVSFERKDTLLKTDITKLKEELEKLRKTVSEARTEQRGAKTVSSLVHPFLLPSR
jgi:predicted Holliday junction resolvase-like endonuclease